MELGHGKSRRLMSLMSTYIDLRTTLLTRMYIESFPELLQLPQHTLYLLPTITRRRRRSRRRSRHRHACHRRWLLPFIGIASPQNLPLKLHSRHRHRHHLIPPILVTNDLHWNLYPSRIATSHNDPADTDIYRLDVQATRHEAVSEIGHPLELHVVAFQGAEVRSPPLGVFVWPN